MRPKSKLKQYIHSLRLSRKWHRWTGTSVALIVAISAITGMLLAFKKEANWLQPSTQKGESTEMSDWKSLDTIGQIAAAALYGAQPDQEGNAIDRMDARPSKGIVKVRFKKRQWEVQIDATSGEVLSVGRRHADWIEAVHDGSIISQLFKLITMNALGIALMIMLVSGLWIWYAPKKVRKMRRRSQK